MKSIKLLRVEKGERMNSIEIKHLTKSFGDTKAVDDLSFSVEKGTFFSFLGINGAGKSTTISIYHLYPNFTRHNQLNMA